MSFSERLIAVCCLWGLITAALAAVEVEWAPEQWTVGFTQLDGINVGEDNRYLLSRIPLMMIDSLADGMKRKLSESEIKGLVIKAVEKALLQKRRQLSQYYSDRDSAFFENDASDDRNAERINTVLSEIADLQSLVPAGLNHPWNVSLVLSDENRGGLLYGSVRYREYFMKKENLDILITGSLEEIEGYFFLEILCFNRLETGSFFRFTTAGSPEKIPSLIEELLNAISAALLNRSISRLVVQVEPESASIRLDGVYSGTGILDNPTIAPGEHWLTVSAPGYADHSELISLENGGETVKRIRLIERSQREVSVVSFPGGADLYLASKWVGTTPLFLVPPQETSQIRLSLDGYHDKSLRIDPQTPDLLKIVLQEENSIAADYTTALRNRFYNSLAGFALFLPLPLMLQTASLDNLSNLERMGTQTDADVRNAQYVKSNLVYTAFSISAVAGVVLFIDLFLNMADYLYNTSQIN